MLLRPAYSEGMRSVKEGNGKPGQGGDDDHKVTKDNERVATLALRSER